MDPILIQADQSLEGRQIPGMPTGHQLRIGVRGLGAMAGTAGMGGWNALHDFLTH